ncbi:hypothetical protein M407DRAFT_126980 [Tulasnella calospora MUT 4182]|uniref:Uncharacterized protein n=1 Tax=Tulasnella calospora MUT 4182 TaxID=1051891 RepID=A0A0C3MKN7_9AGAM|nr:hypothetical protein M407DRAFT_126980 [Tulasnella calospora MUT 4182]
MFSRLATVFVLALSAIYASAAISIIAPGPDYWWVANSQNLYSWTCGPNYNEGYTNFTVLVDNPTNKALFAGPQALIAIQWDYDCSVLLPNVNQLNPGTGYVLSFADVFNMTHIIAQSQPFEVKALGSAYAPQPSGASSAVTATATGTQAAASASSTEPAKNNAAARSPVALGAVTAAMAFVGAAMMM